MSDSGLPHVPYAPFDSRPVVAKDLPTIDPLDPFAGIPTIPGAPRLPTNTEIQAHTPDQEDANWQMVKASLSAMAEAIAENSKVLVELRDSRATFVKSIDARFVELVEFQAEFGRRSDGRWTALNERIGALDKMLIGRFDGVDDQISEQSGLMKAMNQIVSGLRSSVSSVYDMVTSVRRSSIPDGLEEERAKSGGENPGE